jgi:Xaa-Pro dipeptidase
MLDKSIYQSRMDQIQKQLDANNADFALLTPSSNFEYIVGYHYLMRERLVALLIRRGSPSELIVPAFEESDHASRTWIKEIVAWEEDENPYTIIADEIRTKNGGVTVFLDETLPLGIYWSLEKAFGNFQKVHSLSSTLNSLRIIKSEDEVALMRRAGHIIDDAVMKGFSEAQLGMTELQVKQVIQEEIIRQNATPSFATVQFGKNSALPHADSSSRDLRKGDAILMDCGCSIDGYNTDMTRVGVMGDPTKELELVHSIVRKAEEAAIEKVSRGMACGTVDGIARRVIEDAGYGDYFTHRLGHGIGLEVHEPPYLVRGNAQELGAGMCHSIEPGIYLEGQFGVRIEDLVYIQEEGPEVITYSPKDLIILNP